MSAAQIAANQANARLSTGPMTAEGKQRSAANATTHGATSKKVLLPGESQEEYDAFRDSIYRDYRPANDHEKVLAKLVADTTWRYKRLIATEELVMAAGPEPEPGTEGTLSPAENTPPVVQLFLRPEGQKSLSLMLRYVREAERAMFKARTELERIQKLRYQMEMERAAAGACAPRNSTEPNSPTRSNTSLPPSLPRQKTHNQPPARPQQTPLSRSTSAEPNGAQSSEPSGKPQSEQPVSGTRLTVKWLRFVHTEQTEQTAADHRLTPSPDGGTRPARHVSYMSIMHSS